MVNLSLVLFGQKGRGEVKHGYWVEDLDFVQHLFVTIDS